MTIQQCKYVLKIAKTGSFSEAAKQLFIAQSTLSLSVKSLEKEYGIKIFERSGNGVLLTADGEEFIRYAGQIVECNNFMTERYATKSTFNRLNIVAQHYDFVSDAFGKMISQDNQQRYEYSLRELQTQDVIREIEVGSSDIGVIAVKEHDLDVMKRYISGKGLTFTPFLEAPAHIFIGKHHPLAKESRLSVANLKGYPYVSYTQGTNNISFFTEEIDTDIITDRHIEISDRATMMNILLTTDAYTVGTGIISSFLNRNDIISIPLETVDFYRIGYILNSVKLVSPQTQKFIELMILSAKGN